MDLFRSFGWRRLLAGKASALALIFAGDDLPAATKTWTGASINDPTPANRNNFWTTAANWSGNVIPVPGDDLVFPTASLQAASQNTYAPGTSFGKITIENHILVGANIVLTNGISATGGQVSLNGIKIANLQTFTVPGANSSIAITSPIDTNGQQLRLDVTGSIVFAGIISNTGEINKLSGSGTATLAGANTFGNCSVSEGTMLVAGQQPGVPMRVGGNGTIAGNGTVGAMLVTPNQPAEIPKVSPGNSGPAILSVAGDVEFANGGLFAPSRFAVDLNGTDPGTGYDQLNVTGAVKINTSSTLLQVTLGGGFVPTPGDRFVIIQNDGADAVTGSFSSRPEGSLFDVGNTTFQISYAGGDGNDVTLTQVNGVVSFAATTFSANESEATVAIRLKRTGGSNTTAMAALALADVSTNSADYVSPAGKLDTSFNTGTAPGIFHAAVLQPDGKILIGGTFLDIGNTPRRHIARLNADGSLDTTFVPASGFGLNDRVSSIALQPDGKILAGGVFKTVGGAARAGIVRLNADGSLDATFDPGTGATTDLTNPGEVATVAMQSDGKIIIGGSFNFYNGVARKGMARLNANGSLDTAFAPGDFSSNSASKVSEVALDADSKILVAGFFSTVGGVDRKSIARLNSNGSLDTSFNPGTGTNVVNGLAVQPDGKVVIGGFFSSYNGTARNGVARINSDGSLDVSFDPGAGVGNANAVVDDIVVQADGRIVIGGSFSTYNNVTRKAVARLNPNGTLDPSFDPGTGPSGDVLALALQPNGKIFVAGFFDKYQGVNHSNIARTQGDLLAFWGVGDFADKTILLPLVNDSIFEGDEKLGLRIVPLTVSTDAPTTAELTIIDNDVAPAKALNIATRLRVETGDNVMIAGFIITGNANKDVVLRGRGPVLGGFGINDFLADPVLDLRGSGGSILMNNNWKDTQRGQIEGGPFEPSDDRESVILASLAPGAYTGVLTGNNNTTGVGLIEVFDNGSGADSQLSNISTRGLVQGNNSVMIGGFILGGSTSNSRIAIRGIGPSLAQFGLNNVLADPTLELHDGNGALLISNDNWESDTTSAGQLTSNGLGLSDPKEAGIFTSLAPGQFTAILAGKSGGTGIGLIEVYNLQ